MFVLNMFCKPHPPGAHRAVKQTQQRVFRLKRELVVPCGCETATEGRERNKKLKLESRGQKSHS